MNTVNVVMCIPQDHSGRTSYRVFSPRSHSVSNLTVTYYLLVTCVVMGFSRLSLYCPYLMAFQWASRRFLKVLTEVASTTCWGRLFRELITLWLKKFSRGRDGICWRIAWDCVREDHVSYLRDGRTDVGRWSPFLSKSCSTPLTNACQQFVGHWLH